MSKAKKKIPEINVFNRLGHVWTNLNFLGLVLYPEGGRAAPRTWGFWFLWNTVAAIIITAGLVWLGLKPLLEKLETEAWPQVPDFELTVIDGLLTTNLPEPYVIYEDEETLVVIDTAETQYTEAVLKNYDGGLFVNAEKLVGKEDSGEYRSFYFAEFGEDFAFTRQDIENFWQESQSVLFGIGLSVVFVLVWLWLCVWRLLTAVWWALVFWGVGNLYGLKDWSFGRRLRTIFSFYIFIQC